MQDEISIRLAPLVLFHIGNFTVTNTLVTAVIVSILLIFFALMVRRSLKLKPSGFQVLLELLIEYPYNLVRETLDNAKLAEKVYPLIMTLFIFILAVNWFGLLPFVGSIGFFEQVNGHTELMPIFYPGATDLNLTLALAFVVFITIEIVGITTLGVLKYSHKFITFKSPIAFMVGIIELISTFVRLISFSFRLFGNIFAGKVLILVIMFFVPYILPIPILAFEIFIGFIQAAIFAMLTLFFMRIAIEVHADSDEEVELKNSDATVKGKNKEVQPLNTVIG